MESHAPTLESWREESSRSALRALAGFWAAASVWALGLVFGDAPTYGAAFAVTLASTVATGVAAARPPRTGPLRTLAVYLPLYATGSVILVTIGFLPAGALALTLAVTMGAVFAPRHWIVGLVGAEMVPFALGAYRALRGWVPAAQVSGDAILRAADWERAAAATFVASVLVAVVVGRIVRGLEEARAEQARILDRRVEEALMRANAVEELQRAEQRLVAAHRMDALGRFALGVSHAYNNELQVILGWAEALAAAPARTRDEVERGLGAIARAAEAGRQVTAQLLAMSPSRAPTGGPPTDLHRALESQVLLLENLFPEDTRVELLPTPPLAARVAPGDFAQVFSSFALDARSRLRAGDVLRLEARLIEPPAGTPSTPDAITVRLELVRSDGPAPEHLDRLAASAVGGNPELDRTTAETLLERIGGAVRASSPDAGRWWVEIELPLHAVAGEAQPLPSAPSDLSGMTVLLADDDDATRRILQLTLEKAGAAVRAATDADEAVELARAHRGRIDVFCTDAVMPGVPIDACIEAVRKLHPGVEVVVVTGHTSDELGATGSWSRGCTFVTKPVRSRELTDLVGRLRAPSDRASDDRGGTT